MACDLVVDAEEQEEKIRNMVADLVIVPCTVAHPTS